MNSALFLLASSICLVTVYHQALSQRPLCSAPPPPVNGVAPPSPPALQMTCEAQQAAIRNANGGILQWKPRCSNGQRTVQRAFARGYVPQKTTRTLVQVPANRIIPLKPGQNQADTGNVQLPESYSTRDTYRSKCPGVDHVLDQGQCGNCWAAASISMINDRACIYSNDNAAQQFYSWEQLTKCVPGGCHGGSPYHAFQYWQKSGLTTGGAPNLPQAPGCLPYPPLGYQMDGTVTGQQCPARCNDGTNIVTKYYGSQPYQIQLNETEVMQEIYLYGPVVAGFNYYQDFQEYSSGVYNHVYGAGDGGHAMKIVGWGVENGTKYWLVQNSWGPNWGIGGFVKFQRGGNECDIESALNAAVPQDTGIASK